MSVEIIIERNSNDSKVLIDGKDWTERLAVVRIEAQAEVGETATATITILPKRVMVKNPKTLRYQEAERCCDDD